MDAAPDASQDAGHDAAGQPANPPVAGQTHDPRCVSAEMRPGFCPGYTPGYQAYMPGADGQLICTSSEVDRCIEAPLPFATLSECLTTCTPSFDPRATDCKTSGGAIVCAADKSARRAHLTALLPLGALDLRHAWMERYQGFLNGITIHFDSGPDAQDEVSPSVALSLLDPTDAMGLPRVHTTAVAVSLCSGSLALAASVTITIDEVTDHRSERIEGHIKGLDEALKLEGDFAFDRACRVTTND